MPVKIFACGFEHESGLPGRTNTGGTHPHRVMVGRCKAGHRAVDNQVASKVVGQTGDGKRKNGQVNKESGFQVDLFWGFAIKIDCCPARQKLH